MVYVATVDSQGTVLPAAARHSIEMHEFVTLGTLVPSRLHSVVVMLIM